MRVSKNVGSVLFCLIGIGVSVPASAQNVAKAEVSLGYSFVRVQDDELSNEKSFPAGWYADVAGNVTDTLAVVGQVNGTYKTFEDVDLQLHGFLMGVRLSSRTNDGVVPFVQLLGGGIQSSFKGGGVSESEVDGAVQVGGGVNLMPNARVGLRVGADYLRVFAEDEGTNVLRLSAGIVIPFGAR